MLRRIKQSSPVSSVMSSSSYCQGLQSCLEPSRLVEPRVLRLKLAPPNSNFPTARASSASPTPKSHCTTNQEEENNPISNNSTDMGGWSFLQSLYSQSQPQPQPQPQTHLTYTPPSMKRSSSFLCEKSLEMCTENLGSETGSEVCGSDGGGGGGGNAEITAFLSLENVEYNSSNYEQHEHGSDKESILVGNRRSYKTSVSFPPPLTSISGTSGVQVKPHREGGRLVLKAVSVASCQGYFHAERNNGRLTLQMMKDCSLSHYEREEAEVEEEEEEVEEVEEEKEEEEEEERCNWEEEQLEMEGNSGKGGEEMGGMVGMLASRPVSSRCKEREKKALLNWGEPFWVAT